MAVQLAARGLCTCALVLLCVAAAWAQSASPTRQPETGREWLARCGALEQTNTSGSDRRAGHGGQPPAQDLGGCLGWVEGLVDINEIYRGLGVLERTDEGFCTSLTATAADAARTVAHYFRNHPDTLHFSARILAYMALRQAFPCERRTP